MDALPEELLLNILHRLAAKSIGRCLCVKKSWGSLVKTPSFVSADSKIRNKNDQYLLLWGNKNRLELCLDNDTFDSYKLFNIIVSDEEFYLHGQYTVCGISVCNGLICLFKYPDIIMLLNPTIYRLLTLPKPTLVADELVDGKNTFTLWFDSRIDNYKVIRLNCLEDAHTIERPKVEIFSLNNNSWRIISRIPPPFEIHGPSIPILNGAMNWVGCHDIDPRWNAILGFDVNAEVFWIIDFPNILKLLNRSFNLAVYKENSIAICHKYVDGTLEVWVMKEYQNVETWTNIWRNDLSHYQPLHVGPWGDERHVIRLLNNGQVLWEVHVSVDLDEDYLTIISTDPESGIMNRHVVIPGAYYSDVRYFEENLVLLDNASALSTARR